MDSLPLFPDYVPPGSTQSTSASTAKPNSPLANRLRPITWSQFQVCSDLDQRLLEQVMEGRGSPPSMVLWGPPGCGKTSFARLVGSSYQLDFVELSAVLAGVKDIRELVDKAERNGRSVLLFLDEIHRFNKAQQDILLPHVERGTVVLIGATTENPSFALNNAILSRARVIRFTAHSDDALASILDRVSEELQVSFDDRSRTMLIEHAVGDARCLLNAVEALLEPLAGKARLISEEYCREVLSGRGYSAYDRSGDAHYDMISAFIKSMRGSDPDAALYWGFQMLQRGEPGEFLVRRMIVFASEDIGNADPQALQVAVATATAFERIGLPEGRIPIAQCITYLACAPKSNRSYLAMKAVLHEIEQGKEPQVPLHLRNAPTKLLGSLGHGQGYRYPHDEQYGYALGQTYLPDGVSGGWYRPTSYGQEKVINERLRFWRELK